MWSWSWGTEMSPCHLLHLLGLFQEFQAGRGGCWSLSDPSPVCSSWRPHSQSSELREQPLPDFFSPGPEPLGESPWCKPRTLPGIIQGSHLDPRLLPSFLSLCLMDTSGKGPFPSPMGAFALGIHPGLFSSKIHGISFPEHHIPVSFPADSWESPPLRFLHPRTLKQKPGDAS